MAETDAERRERFRSYQARYHEKHRDEINARQRARRANAKQATNAYYREYYAKNRGRILEQTNAYKSRNPEKQAEYRARSKERIRLNIVARKYGVSRSEYKRLIKEQNGVCAICAKPPTSRALAVDHCHESGLVRGLLCINCNLGIGKFGDSIEQLEKALAYLRRFE